MTDTNRELARLAEQLTAPTFSIEPVDCRDYTAEEFDTALLTLVMHGGNYTKAAKACKAKGMRLNHTTLRRWRETHPRRYQAIEERHFSKLEDVIVSTQRALILTASEAAQEHVQAARDQLKAEGTKDPSKAAQALQTVAGIAAEKVLMLTGRPQAVVAHVDAGDTLKRISSRFGGLVVEEALDSTPEGPQLGENQEERESRE